jgi:hypothetical protein
VDLLLPGRKANAVMLLEARIHSILELVCFRCPAGDPENVIVIIERD